MASRRPGPDRSTDVAGVDTALVRRARRVNRILAEEYPDARCELDYRNPYELLVATVLSAQCTDVQVNRVTPALFAAFPDAAALAAAPRDRLESLIRSTGFFRAKAESLLELSRGLVERFDGRVPDDLASLVTLRGVGRKTANVVLGNAFGVPGIPVDTHVGRLARRLGWTTNARSRGGRARPHGVVSPVRLDAAVAPPHLPRSAPVYGATTGLRRLPRPIALSERRGVGRVSRRATRDAGPATPASRRPPAPRRPRRRAPPP